MLVLAKQQRCSSKTRAAKQQRCSSKHEQSYPSANRASRARAAHGARQASAVLAKNGLQAAKKPLCLPSTAGAGLANRSGARKPSAVLVTQGHGGCRPCKDSTGPAQMVPARQECFLAMCGQTQPSKDHASASQATAVLDEHGQSYPSANRASQARASKSCARQERAASGPRNVCARQSLQEPANDCCVAPGITCGLAIAGGTWREHHRVGVGQLTTAPRKRSHPSLS